MLASRGTICYNVSGKGGAAVRLNYPKKPRESRVMKYVNLGGTAIMLNLLFLLMCIPVVTIGPAFSGLYSGVRYMIRGDGAVRGFFEGFRTNLVRMMVAGLIFVGIVVYFVFVVNGAYNTWIKEGVFRDLAMQGVCAMIPLMLLSALIPLNIYVPYGVTDWLRNGVNLIVKAPHWVFLSALMTWLPVILFFWSRIFVYVMVVVVALWYTLSAFVSTLFLKDTLLDMLLDYRQEHPEEDTDE